MAKQDMKTNEQQTSSSQGHEVAHGSQHQRGAARGAGYNLGLAISPVDFFRMSPFGFMRRMSEEMDRVFGRYGMAPAEEAGGLWSPAIEVAQREGNYLIHADLPGIKPDDVKLQITDEAIVIEGERKAEREESRGGVHLTERRYGEFYRSIPLPEGAKSEEAKARFDNGVLEIVVPMAEQRSSKPRSIPITSGPTPQSGSSQASGQTQGKNQGAAAAGGSTMSGGTTASGGTAASHGNKTA